MISALAPAVSRSAVIAEPADDSVACANSAGTPVAGIVRAIATPSAEPAIAAPSAEPS